MRSIIMSIAIVIVVVGLAIAQEEIPKPSRVFVMDESKTGPIVIVKPDAQWIKYESLKTGIDSKGVYLTTLYSVPNSNTQFAGLKIDKGGYIALHTGTATFPMYVAAGKGRSTFKDGSKLDYQAGDTIVFMPNHYHTLENIGDEPLVYIYARVMPLIK